MFLLVPGSSLILFAFVQVVVFKSDGSVLLNEMTVNVPHVSGKGYSLKCCHTADFSCRAVFFQRQKLERGM